MRYCTYFAPSELLASERTLIFSFPVEQDTNQIKFVLSAVNDIIIQVNLRDCGLL